MWINPSNNKHWLVGCDGGMYETFDAAKTWDFKENIPVTQFYKVAVDNDYPFYNVYGGAQDNGSWFGPSQTHRRSLVNADWTYTIGGDGYLSIPDPNNPDIHYCESQYCGLRRYDRTTGNSISIISYGAAVHYAAEVLDKNPNISADLIDLRSLCPLDVETIINSVNKTGKAIILQEDSLFGGLASEISSIIMENCFESLDAPVRRVASLNTPIPFEASLEKQYLPYSRFESELIDLFNY